MTRRQQLSDAQIVAMFDPPTEHHELVRHYTLSDADLAAIRRCRGDHNRLGHALMLCYLRHPGRPLRAGERPPEPLLAFVAEQIGVLPEAIDTYLAAERNRVGHSAELQDRLRLRPFGPRPAAALSTWLLPLAVEDDRLVHWPGWSWESVGAVGSSSPGPLFSNASAWKCVTRRGGRCITAWSRA